MGLQEHREAQRAIETHQVKIYSNSISWFEPGKLRAHRRLESGRSLWPRAALFSLIGLLIASALIFYTARKFDQSMFTWDAIIIWVLFSTAPFMIVIIRGHLGRSIALTEDFIARVNLGSRVPNRIAYTDIDHCVFRSFNTSGKSFLVLDIMGADGKLDEIELPRKVDTATISKFLGERDVSIR